MSEARGYRPDRDGGRAPSAAANVSLLTVVVPVHRVEPYLRRCLDSVLAGAGTEVEVVAVDDHSPDGCGAILDRYAAHDSRVRVVRLATNVGLGRARNAGLALARGDYVWFVDGDDWLPPGTLPAVLRRLMAIRPDVLMVDHVEVFDDGRTRPGTLAGEVDDLAPPFRLAQRPGLLRLAQCASACTKVVRRGFLREIGLRFPPGWYEDCAYSYPLLMAARSLDVLGRVCYCYRQRAGGGITRTVSPRHVEVFAQYERLFAVVDRHAAAYDVFRPELFRLMVNHLLVIAGSERRLPPSLRRAFFRQAAQRYRRWLPSQGYDVPGGVAGLKHRLLGRDAYLAYAALRLAYRVAGLRGRLATAQPDPVAALPANRQPAAAGAKRGTRSRGADLTVR
jgi:CDP-glycerol glycerophosphotransferase